MYYKAEFESFDLLGLMEKVKDWISDREDNDKDFRVDNINLYKDEQSSFWFATVFFYKVTR